MNIDIRKRAGQGARDTFKSSGVVDSSFGTMAVGSKIHGVNLKEKTLLKIRGGKSPLKVANEYLILKSLISQVSLKETQA